MKVEKICISKRDKNYIQEYLSNFFLKKGYKKSFLCDKTNFQKKISNLSDFIIEELQLFDFFVIDNEHRLRECYAFVNKGLNNKKRLKIIGQVDVDLYEVFYKNEKITIKPFSKLQSRSLGLYISIIECCNNFFSNDEGDYLYFYRGHENIDYKLIPSLFRDKKLLETEKILYFSAIRENPEEFNVNESSFENLVKMQHYQLPTRLLDITTSPLIALYFAVNNNKKDGVVYIFKVPKSEVKNFWSDDVKTLDDYFYGKTDHYSNKLMCVLPNLSNDRLKCQSGAFFVFSTNKANTSCPKIKYLHKRIIIKKEDKYRIKKSLSILQIDESHLFPELEHRLAYLKDNI